MTLQANFENYVYVVHDTPTPPTVAPARPNPLESLTFLQVKRKP